MDAVAEIIARTLREMLVAEKCSEEILELLDVLVERYREETGEKPTGGIRFLGGGTAEVTRSES